MSMVVLWWWKVVWCFARELAGRRVSREELPLRGDRRLCLSPEAGRPAGEPGRTPAEGRPADAAYTQLFFLIQIKLFFQKKICHLLFLFVAPVVLQFKIVSPMIFKVFRRLFGFLQIKKKSFFISNFKKVSLKHGQGSFQNFGSLCHIGE